MSPGTKTRCALPSPAAAMEWHMLAANNVKHQQTGPFRRCQGAISAACVRSMFGKTSLALVLFFFHFVCHSNISGTKGQGHRDKLLRHPN